MSRCLASLLLLFAMLGCGRLEFEHTPSPDGGMDAAADAGTCDDDTDCAACEQCTAGACVAAADGTDCTGGVCQSGVCCSGCLDEGSCKLGETPSTCGAGGSACVTCAECESCSAGACEPAADGTSCPDGVCVSGSCCTPSCEGATCGDDGCGGSCGTCELGSRCEGGACMMTACVDDPDCLPCETCTAENVCVPRADGSDCPGGQCFGGICCEGCWDGEACRAGTAATACGGAGGACATCGACESCDEAVCAPAGDGAMCSGGLCRDGACCTGCWDGTTCQAGSALSACGAAGGMCSTCAECEACADGRCDPAPDATACPDGTCQSGACCTGCWDGAACQPGTDDLACGVGGVSCTACATSARCDRGTCVSSCAYTCAVSLDSILGENCDGLVDGSIAAGTDEFTARIDMAGRTELEWTITVCDSTDWTVHITDSSTGNGGGGDAATSSNDAEVNITTPRLLEVIGNQMDPAGPSRRLLSQSDYLPASGCETFTWTIRDQFFSESLTGFSATDPYLLRIDPPTDTEGTPDALWWVGLNRTYGSAARTGSGVTQATFCIR